MDQVIEYAVAMMETNWKDLENDLKDITDDELDWKLLPESNTIRSILRHLRTLEQIYLSLLEDGDNTPWKDGASMRKLADSVGHDFRQIMEEFKDLHAHMITSIKATTLDDLKVQTFLFVSPEPQTKDNLIFREIKHIATHRGQIRTLRNLYRRTKGEEGLFVPKNSTFSE